MGYHGRATVHGFRATASTILNEHQFNRDWIEMQLAHASNKIRAAYNAAEWLPGRRKMMLWWADYLDHAREGAGAPGAPEAEQIELPAAALSLYARMRPSGGGQEPIPFPSTERS
jgi:hypothetical protein